MRVIVIIPSAGSGSRFGSSVPKQYLDLGGRPVLQHAVDRFLAVDSVRQVVLAVAADQLAPMSDDPRWSDPRVTLVEGGATRQESVTRALQSVREHSDLVAVHDAVRPFISEPLLMELLATAQEYGASLPVLHVTDTIHVVEGGRVVETLDRSRLGAAQTPQCFRTDVLREVLRRAEAGQVDGTDEAGLAVKFGFDVRAVPGDALNFKITHEQDLERARRVLEEWRRP